MSSFQLRVMCLICWVTWSACAPARPTSRHPISGSLPAHCGWRQSHGWPATISEFFARFWCQSIRNRWNVSKWANFLSRFKSSLSYAESGVIDGCFFRAPSKVSKTALVIACSVPQCYCKMWLLYIKMILMMLAVEWRGSFSMCVQNHERHRIMFVVSP